LVGKKGRIGRLAFSSSRLPIPEWYVWLRAETGDPQPTTRRRQIVVGDRISSTINPGGSSEAGKIALGLPTA
jgi:hypothetical protein